MPGKTRFVRKPGGKVVALKKYMKNAPKRRVSKQARFNFSRTQYRLNKAVSKAMSRMNETKLVKLNNINGAALNGTPTNVIGAGANARAYAWRGVLESVPVGWENATGTQGDGLNNLGGIITTQGLAENEHVGSYVYLKKTHLSLQIDMIQSTTLPTADLPQLQFRMIVCKSRQGAQPAGTTTFPQTGLFLNQVGDQQGHASTGNNAMSTFEVLNNPINKRDWVVLKDQKFIMEPAITGTGKYPSRKNFYLNLPHYVKARLGANGAPIDYDAKYLIYIYCNAVGVTTSSGLPDDWRVTLRGTTSYTDS